MSVVAEDRLDYVPEYLTDDAKRALAGLAVESEAEPAPLEVSEYLIRHWCETLEDGNPLYLDEEYARSQGFGGLVAPPASVMTTFSLPFRWPWPAGGDAPGRHIHYEVKELLGLPVGIVTEIEVEYGEPLLVGDRVSVSQRLVSISPGKRTRLGQGHFWTMDRLYRNQHAEMVARERMTVFGYGREEGPSDGGQTRGWSPAVEEAIEGDRTGYEPTVRELFWEDVPEGDELPVLTMPINLTRSAYLASATRDFSPQHSNRDYARERSGTRDVFVNTPFNMGMVSRYLTDWAGPRARVRKIGLAMRGAVCAGDDMVLTGRVTRKYEEGGDHRLDLEVLISTQDGPATPCTATISLPSRGAAS